MTDKKDLVQIIRDNPGCCAVVDNDYWKLYKVDPYGEDAPNEDSMSYEAYSKWEEENEIASYDNIKPIGDGGYGSGSCYGGDILQALAQIVGVKVQSV